MIPRMEATTSKARLMSSRWRNGRKAGRGWETIRLFSLADSILFLSLTRTSRPAAKRLTAKTAKYAKILSAVGSGQ